MAIDASVSRSQSRLFDVLKHALKLTSADDLKELRGASTSRLPATGKRRLKNLGTLVTSVADAVNSELRIAILAWKRGYFGKHLEQWAAADIVNSIELGQRAWRTAGAIGHTLIDI